jgi:hypothetical protein
VCCASVSQNLQDSWELDEDGWVTVDGSKRVIWVPPEVRVALLRPHNIAVLSRAGLLSLDFINATIGEDWHQCYRLGDTASITHM